MNVLVIENDPSDRKLIREALKWADHVIHECVSAEEALVAVVAEKPDIVLFDLRLPGMDGLTLARLLKDNPETRQIPMVAVTALPERFQAQGVLAAGCDACVVKPVDAGFLAGQLKEMAGKMRGTQAK